MGGVMIWRNVEPKDRRILHAREYKKRISKRVTQPKRKVRSVKTMKKDVNQIQRIFRQSYKSAYKTKCLANATPARHSLAQRNYQDES